MKTAPTLMTGLCLLGLSALGSAQQPRTAIEIDDANLAVSPDGLDISIDGAGDVRVCVWPDDRAGAFNDDLFCSVSTDRGLSWGPEIQITDFRTTGVPSLSPQMVYRNGIIHVICQEDTAAARDNDLAYWRSDDLGQTWTRQLLATEMFSPRIDADEDDVIVLYGKVPLQTDLYTRWSDDEGLSFEAAVDVEPSFNGDIDDWGLSIQAGKAHVAYGRAKDLWYAQSWSPAGAYHSHARIDDAPAATGDPRNPEVIAEGGALHVVWNSLDRNGGAFGDSAIYYVRSPNLGTSWDADRLIGQYPAGLVLAHHAHLAVDSNVVAIEWSDDRSGVVRNYVVTSEDFGTTFSADFEVPLTPNGNSVLWGDIRLEHNTIAVLSLEHVQGGAGLRRVPTLVISNDVGGNWSDAMDLHPDLLDGSRDSVGFRNLHIQDSGINAAWTIRDGPDTPRVLTAGLRLPVVEFRKTTATKAVLDMKFVDVRHQGDTARWVASSVLGSMVHPENPALQIQLGASGTFNQSMSKAAILSGSVNAAGEASSKQIPIKPSLIGKTIHLQGWINNLGLGEPPSEVLTVVIS